MGRSSKKAQQLLYLPHETLAALKAKAAATGRTMSDIVSRVLEKNLQVKKTDER